MRTIQSIFIALGLFVIGLPAFGLEVGDTAPCVVLEGLSAQGAPVTGCIRDTVEEDQEFTLVEFFSIDCKTCQGNLPTLSGLTKDLTENATVRVVTINPDVAAVKAFLNDPAYKNYVTFPVAFDSKQKAWKAWAVSKTPTHFLLNKESKVVYKHVGALKDANLEEIRKIVLSEE